VCARVDTALHFIFYKNEVKVYSLILMETFRFHIFFLLCYYFSKKVALLNTVTVTDNIIPPPSVGVYSVESGALSTRLISESSTYGSQGSLKQKNLIA